VNLVVSVATSVVSRLTPESPQLGIRMVPKCPTLPAKWAAPIELSSDHPIRSDALPLASPAEVAPFSILTEAPASGSE